MRGRLAIAHYENALSSSRAEVVAASDALQWRLELVRTLHDVLGRPDDALAALLLCYDHVVKLGSEHELSHVVEARAGRLVSELIRGAESAGRAERMKKVYAKAIRECAQSGVAAMIQVLREL